MYPVQLRPTMESQANYAVEWLTVAQEVGCDRFSSALVQAVRDSDFFPTVSKIRRLAGLGSKEQTAAGADAAWLYLEDYLRKFPLYDYSYGARRPTGTPELPPRIAHAVRLVGGLRKIEFATEEAYPFIRKDFCQAWNGYEESAAAYNELQLTSPILSKLLGTGKDIKPEKRAELTSAVKTMPAEQKIWTDAELEELKRKAEQVAKTFQSRPTGEKAEGSQLVTE